MRTTLAIDDDILMAARHLADVQKRTIGEVISDLARSALAEPEETPTYRNGILQLPTRPGVVVTPELIRQLDDETP